MAGIIKAGDGGSGARARDGEGGNDTTDGSAPGVLTYWDGNGGSKGDRGIAAHFGMLTEGSQATATVDRSIVVPSDNSTPGKQGNDGWGGVNLTKCSYDKENPDSKLTGANSEPKAYHIFEYVYCNGYITDSYSQNSNSIKVNVRVRKVNDTDEDSRAEIELETNGNTEEVNITFTKNDTTANITYEYTLPQYNESTGHGVICISKHTQINRFIVAFVGWFKIERLQVDVYRYDRCTEAEMYGLVKGSNNAFSWSKVN